MKKRIETKQDDQGLIAQQPQQPQQPQGMRGMRELPKSNDTDAELGLSQIPFSALKRLAAIFMEGERTYGRGNWRTGVGTPEGFEYDDRRLCHAIKHLMLFASGDLTEDHLAKVMWFCATQIERDRLLDFIYQDEEDAEKAAQDAQQLMTGEGN